MVDKYLRCDLSLFFFGGRFDALLGDECLQDTRVRILWISKVQNFYVRCKKKINAISPICMQSKQLVKHKCVKMSNRHDLVTVLLPSNNS